MLICLIWVHGNAPEAVNGQSNAFLLKPTEADDATIRQWVDDLSSDSYLRRRRATQDLVAVGPKAVPHLVDVLGRGDLESTERAITALQQIAINQPFMPRSMSSSSGDVSLGEDESSNAIATDDWAAEENPRSDGPPEKGRQGPDESGPDESGPDESGSDDIDPDGSAPNESATDDSDDVESTRNRSANAPSESDPPRGTRGRDKENKDSVTSGDEAWEALEQIAGMGGSRAARATQAIREVRQVRRKTVTQRLMQHGVQIGTFDVVLRARNTLQRIVQIGEDYSGSDQLLTMLRWVDRIGMARIEGPAVRKPVLAAVAEMPDLHTISLVQGEIDWPALRALGDLPPVRHLEFRYVPLDAEMVDYLATLPVTVSLTLNGTGAPAERVAALKKALPGLDIEFKQGGFLGVKCYDSVNSCVINEVVADSGAEAAGLIPGDVITAVDGKPIQRFSDLQEAINAHLPGDQIKLSYRRAELERTTTAKLGKLVEN